MEKIVDIPDGVEIEVENFKISVKGPKGTLERDFHSTLFRRDVVIKKEGNKILVSTESTKRKMMAMVGTIAAHTKNMSIGVTEGFTARLKSVYMHFPFKTEIAGKEITINNFLGEKIPRKMEIAGDCKVEINGDEVTVTGIDKEDVGLTCARLERATKIKSRDRRIFQDGIFRVE